MQKKRCARWPADLVRSQATGRVSATKLWLHIANIVMTICILRQDEVSWELMAVYAACVGGSYVGSKFVGMKYGPGQYSSAPQE